MPEKAELLIEANRRGLLPPEKKQAFDEAVRRGLIKDGGPQEQNQSQTAKEAGTSGVDSGGFNEQLIGTLRSLVGQGMMLGFGDEATAFVKSLIEGTRFEDEFKTKTEELEKFREESPILATGGEIAGALALPIGGAAGGATLAARAARGAGIGAGVGGTFGVGTGRDAEERIAGGISGATLGAGLGAAAPAIVEGAVRGARAVGRSAREGRIANTFRGATDPQAEAGRRVSRAVEADVAAGDAGLTVAEGEVVQRVGVPTAVIDTGGETTRALARSAANVSPEARATLNRTINDRFETQGQRITQAIHNINRVRGGQSNAILTRAQLQEAARRANRPAYRAAYEAGDRPINSPEIDRLIGAPEVVEAIKRAGKSGKSRAIRDGFGGFRNAFTVTDDGRLIQNKGKNGVPIFPNLQFWDQVKRELDDIAGAARSRGRHGAADLAEGHARDLRNELDRIVPEYGEARAGAAQFFGAGDALEAGENFVTSRMSNGEARQALERMSEAERGLFREGFVSRFIDRADEARDRTNILNQINGSPAARERLEIALGPRGARQLQALMRVESIMDRARGAIQGNSTTARQLTELGLAGGVGGFTTGGGDFTSVSGIAGVLGGVLAARAGRRSLNRIEQNVARRVAEMLTSGDLRSVQRAAQAFARNPRALQTLDVLDNGLAKTLAQQSSRAETRTLQGPTPAGAQGETPGIRDDQPNR